MARKYTPFNGPGGESFTTDAERMDAASAHQQAAIEAMRRGQQPQGMGEPVMFGGPSENDLRNRTINAREQQQHLLASAGEQERLGIQAADVGKNYRADAQMRPSLMGAEDSRAEYQEGKPLRDLMSERVLQGFQGGSPMNDQQMDQMALLGAIANKQQMPNLRGQRRQDELAGLQIEDYKRKGALERIQQLADAGDMAGANALAATAGVAVPKQKFGDPNMELSELKAQTQAFGAKDAATFGWDPDQQDVARLDAKANRAIELLVRDYRMPPEEARRIVNQAIQESTAGSAGSIGTGWIDALLQQRGIQ